MEWSETNWTTEITPGPSGHPSAPSFDQDYITPASSSAPWSAADNATIAAALEFREASRFWVQRVLVPVLVTVGVLGNLVTVVVLTRRRMRSSTNVYLTALAVSDLLYLVFMFSMSLMHYPHFHETPYRSYWEYRRFGLWFTDATSSSSVWLTVSFTVERYIAVCHPLRGKVLCTEKRARTVILAVVLACALSTATTPHEWRVAEHEGRVTLAESPFGAHETYRAVFYWFSSVTFTLLPLVLLGIFNSFLVLAVHRSQRQRFRMTQVDQHESSSSAQTQENRITIVLISVVVLFMVCQMPTAVLLIYTALHPVEGAHEVIAQGLGNIFNFLMAVHSSCNFLLYCALSDKYRRTFMLAFFPKCAPPPTSGPGASSSAYSAASTYRGSASMRVRSDANGSGTDPGAPLKRHVSAYIPRPRVQSSPKP